MTNPTFSIESSLTALAINQTSATEYNVNVIFNTLEACSDVIKIAENERHTIRGGERNNKTWNERDQF